MRRAVRTAFRPFTIGFEGEVDCMYLDRHDPPLVTIAWGNLLSIEQARTLPFVHVNGGYVATPSEIEMEWHIINGTPRLSVEGWRAAKKIAKLRLTYEGMEQLAFHKLDEVNAYLVKRFPAFESWPGDAQLGTVSCSWASGAAWKAPRFDACVRALNFAKYTVAANGGRALIGGAAIECHMRDTDDPTTPQNETNHGLTPRNRANRILFENAARVLEDGLDPDVLYYPRDLAVVGLHDTPRMVPLPFDADTQPSTTYPSSLTEAIEAGIADYQKEREPK